MIYLDDKHAIDSDGLQVILYENKTYSSGNNIGEEYQVVLGYYSCVEHALKGYCRIMGLYAVQSSATLKELVEALKTLDKRMTELAKGVL